MNFLLFLLGISFFFIFFSLSQVLDEKESFLGSIFLEWNIYIIICFIIIFLSLFWKKDVKWDNIPEEAEQDSLGHKISVYMSYFFKDIVYYIGVLFFYLSFYFIFSHFFWAVSLPQIFLFCNFLVIILFFLEHRISLFSDILRVNTSIISLYYIFVHIFVLFFSHSINISLFDIGNISCVFLLLYLFLYSSGNQNKSHIALFYCYIFWFLFLESAILLKFLGYTSLYNISFLSFIFWVFLSIFPQKIEKYIKIPIKYSRWFSVVFLSVFILLAFISFSFWKNISLINVFSLLLSTTLLWFFHKIFENYIAAFFSVLAVYFSIFLICYDIEIQKFVFIPVYILSHLLFIYRKIFFHEWDIYFFHSLSLLVNLSCVFFFFYFIDFSILKLGIFFLIESVYFLTLYYSYKLSQKYEIPNEALWDSI